MKPTAKENLYRRFGSRKVFIVHTICLVITLATVLSSIILTFVAEDHTIEKMIEHLALCALAILLLNIPIFMRTKLKYHIPSFLHIIIAIFIIAHCVLGEIYRFYDYIFIFDKVLHITAGVVIATLGFSVVYGFGTPKSGSVRLSPFFIALFSFCFALALLVLWEVFEYAMDSFFGLNMQRWQDGLSEIYVDGVKYLVTKPKQGSGLIDTMTDLIVGIIGAVIICFAGGFLLKKYPDSTRFFIVKNRKVVRTDIERAKKLLSENENTCALVKGDTVHTSKAKGISPMVNYISSGADLKGFSAADRIVGRATALLFVLAEVFEVYAEVLSEGALEVFKSNNIKCEYGTLAEKILNRDGTDFCPMEKAVEGIDSPLAALDAVKEKLEFLRNETEKDDAPQD